MELQKCHKTKYFRKLAFRYRLTSPNNNAIKSNDGVCESSQDVSHLSVTEEIKESNKATSCSKTRNSIFRSLRKVQNRVIFCVSRQRVQSIESKHSLNAFNEEEPELPKGNQIAGSLEAINSTTIHDELPPQLPKRELHPHFFINHLVIDDQIVRNGRVPAVEIFNLANSCWYWGPMSRQEAEKKLCQESDGSFLVRDSSSDSYLFTVSFRSVGHTFHARIEHARGCYSLFDQEGHSSVAELIENAMIISKESLYCYTRPRNSADPMFPVRLTSPVSRFTQLKTLKYLCRFVIRQFTNVNDISKLPIPKSLQVYLQQGHY